VCEWGWQLIVGGQAVAGAGWGFNGGVPGVVRHSLVVSGAVQVLAGEGCGNSVGVGDMVGEGWV